MQKILLASQSKYKRLLIKRLGLTVDFLSADIDETPQHKEDPYELVKRLSFDKANKVAEAAVDSWIIGTDQIALYKKTVLGKAGSKNNAIKQLKLFSGNSVQFITGIALLNTNSKQSFYEQSIVEVKFRSLTDSQISSYLDLDEPYDCAGSFKIESLGISLFESVKSTDPTSLEGLPLISLCNLFRQAGIEVLKS